jgi:hypothetical protein
MNFHNLGLLFFVLLHAYLHHLREDLKCFTTNLHSSKRRVNYLRVNMNYKFLSQFISHKFQADFNINFISQVYIEYKNIMYLTALMHTDINGCDFDPPFIHVICDGMDT